MKARFITSLIILAVLIPMVLLSEYIIYPIALALVSLLAVYEMLHVCELDRAWLVSVPAYILALGLPFGCYFVGENAVSTYLLIVAALIFIYLMYLMSVAVFSRGKLIVARASWAFFTVTYIVVSLTSLSLVRYIDRSVGLYYVILAFAASWVSDACAFLVGSLIGKHKLIPEISPKKTVEGAIGGVVCAMIAFLLFGFILDLIIESLTVNYIVLAVLGLVLAVISQVGDLIASAIKRENGIKDYSNLLPGHGGIMDRFDSLLPVSTALLVICMIFPPFTII